jgi:hypothetical protein
VHEFSGDGAVDAAAYGADDAPCGPAYRTDARNLLANEFFLADCWEKDDIEQSNTP